MSDSRYTPDGGVHICGDCGAVIADTGAHDRFHAALAASGYFGSPAVDFGDVP